jgi:hypothetical protein
MKVYGSRTHAHVGAGALAATGASVGAVGSRTSNAIIGVAEGALAVALWSPIGFKEKHPIWGTIFGVMAAFNIIDAALP